jgi:4-hydroxy-2-oxoheptanedioate aldolase
MSTNPILRVKDSGGRIIGPWLSLGSTIVAETLAQQGFDFIAIDMQHGSIGWDTIGPAIQAIELGGACAVVRVPWNSPDYIMRVLDLGAVGVIVPMVSTAAEARAASGAVRYPPQGLRSFGPIRQSADGKPIQAACLVMIETKAGLENIREIAATPGVDGLFLGPVDLALDLGLPVSITPHATVVKAIGTMIAVCAETKIVAGAASLDAAGAEELLKNGVQFVTLSGDLAYMRRALQADADLAKRWRTPQ